MNNVGIECNGVYVGSMRVHGRKKPCLVVERGNEALILGTFNSDRMVEEFEKALKELLGNDGVK